MVRQIHYSLIDDLIRYGEVRLKEDLKRIFLSLIFSPIPFGLSIDIVNNVKKTANECC